MFETIDLFVDVTGGSLGNEVGTNGIVIPLEDPCFIFLKIT